MAVAVIRLGQGTDIGTGTDAALQPAERRVAEPVVHYTMEMARSGAEFTPEGQHLANETGLRKAVRYHPADIGHGIEPYIKRGVESPSVEAAHQPVLEHAVGAAVEKARQERMLKAQFG